MKSEHPVCECNDFKCSVELPITWEEWEKNHAFTRISDACEGDENSRNGLVLVKVFSGYKTYTMQPKNPNDPQPFLCMRCGMALSPVRPGFLDRNGFPVHVDCGETGEVEEYQTANGGTGYRLSPGYFPGWQL